VTKFTCSIKKSRLLYLELWDQLQDGGCPICSLVQKQCRGVLSDFLKSLNPGPEGKSRQKNPGSLCFYHMWQLKNAYPSDLYPILDGELKHLEACLGNILHVLERETGLKRLFRAYRNTIKSTEYLAGRAKRCRACQVMHHVEKSYLKTLLDAINEPGFAREFDRAAEICFPHVLMAVEQFPRHNHLSMLIKKQVEISRYMKSAFQDHHFGRLPQAESSDRPPDHAWEKALEFTCGKEGLLFSLEAGADVKDALPGDHEPLYSPSQENQGGVADVSQLFEAESFENEKLKRQIEGLNKMLNEESTRAASLHYRYWKCMEDNKTLQLQLAGAKSRISLYRDTIDRLKSEKESLRASPPEDSKKTQS